MRGIDTEAPPAVSEPVAIAGIAGDMLLSGAEEDAEASVDSSEVNITDLDLTIRRK